MSKNFPSWGGAFLPPNQSCSKLPEMDRSDVKIFSLIGGGGFCHQNQSCSKLPEMDRSDVKKFSLIWGGAFLPPKQSCSKLPEMDRSGVKKFSLIWGGLFCHQKQSCSKLPEMDRSDVKNFSLIWKGGFSATKTKVARNCLKWIDLVSKNFPSCGGGLFCHQKQSCSKSPEMDRSGVKNFPLIWGGGGFSAKLPPM